MTLSMDRTASSPSPPLRVGESVAKGRVRWRLGSGSLFMSILWKTLLPMIRLCIAVLVAVTLLPGRAAGGEDPAMMPGLPAVRLGDAPRAPDRTDSLNVRNSAPRLLSTTGGFSVNTASREAVRNFFRGVFGTSDGVPLDSTADVANCVAGNTSSSYQEAVLRRINWYRAMAGVPADVSLDPANHWKCQETALMMSAENGLSHFPPIEWACYTDDGALGARNSNIAIGNAGPDAITAYMMDHGGNNAAVGHRRWILYPQTQIMATGDVPSQGNFALANAVWVFDAHYGGSRPSVRDSFVAWPPPGFVPYSSVFPRWSFAIPDADFSGAKVTMRSNGVVVPVSLELYDPGAGENTLVWYPVGFDNQVPAIWPKPLQDTVFQIKIDGILSAPASSYSYLVTVFDPAVPGSDTVLPAVGGTSHPEVGQGNAYSFPEVEDASGYRWRSSRRQAFSLSDGAEDGTANFYVNASTNGYSVITDRPVSAGSHSFHLAHPAPPVSQSLALRQVFIPKSDTVLTFKSRLGWASEKQMALVEISVDDGASWTVVYSQAGTGTAGETVFQPRTIPLSGQANRSTQLRFRYGYDSFGSYFPQTEAGVGWYIDQIAINGADIGLDPVSSNITAPNFSFVPPQVGDYLLEVRGLLYGEFPLEWGPALRVTAVGSGTGSRVIRMGQPILSAVPLQLPFDLVSGSVGTFHLQRSAAAGGAWEDDASASLQTIRAGSSYRYTLPRPPTARFFRVRVD